MPKLAKPKDALQELTEVFKNLLNEYAIPSFLSIPDSNDNVISAFTKEQYTTKEVSPKLEQKLIAGFLAKSCRCGKNCQNLFSAEELFGTRADFRSLTWDSRNCSILSQLRSCQKFSNYAKSARSTKDRQRQKFDYRINADRPVCRDVFLFYNGETLKRLKYLQKHLTESGALPPVHGNKGRTPHHACSAEDKQDVGRFILNFAAMHGMPDPGRDLRKGKGKLRILLPAVLNYRSIHRDYQKSLFNSNSKILEYRSFVRIWQEMLPHICFSKPRSDLCMTCENFKKTLNQIASDLSEEREDEKIRVHQQAIEHLENAKKEREYYHNCIKISEKNYHVISNEQPKISCKPNSRQTSMHYSWDFAQKIPYPFENQQVGPIYFKSPRKAHLFGVCNEGIPQQVNYLIDEADFLEKNSNVVISLLDHFFKTHAIGETHAYLTADNSVAQNKNNAVLQYLVYRRG